jgi:hypothetical protein
VIVFGVDPAYDEKLVAYVEWERKQDAFAFHRTDYRHTILKRKCDCGCWIDGSEPYRYQGVEDQQRAAHLSAPRLRVLRAERQCVLTILIPAHRRETRVRAAR